MRRRTTTAAWAAALAVACLAGRAAADPTIEFTGLATGQIPVSSFAFGVTQTGSTGFGPTSKRVVLAEFSNLTLTRSVDAYSAQLVKALVEGTSLGTATLRVPDEFVTTTITLTEPTIVSYSVSGSAGTPAESMALTFARIDYDSGGKKFCWNVVLRKPC